MPLWVQNSPLQLVRRGFTWSQPFAPSGRAVLYGDLICNDMDVSKNREKTPQNGWFIMNGKT